VKSRPLKLSVILLAAVAMFNYCCVLVSFESFDWTSIERRYIEGVGNETLTKRHSITLQVLAEPKKSEVVARLVACSPIDLAILIGYVVIIVRSRRYYKEARKVFCEEGDLLTVADQPLKGELLPPVRAIELRY
jgi:hypothetical protein